jgi:hypothetical protein
MFGAKSYVQGIAELFNESNPSEVFQALIDTDLQTIGTDYPLNSEIAKFIAKSEPVYEDQYLDYLKNLYTKNGTIPIQCNPLTASLEKFYSGQFYKKRRVLNDLGCESISYIGVLADFYNKKQRELEHFEFNDEEGTLQIVQLSGEEDYTTFYSLSVTEEKDDEFLEGFASVDRPYGFSYEMDEKEMQKIVDDVKKSVEIKDDRINCYFELGDVIESQCAMEFKIPIKDEFEDPDKMDSELLEISNDIWRKSTSKFDREFKKKY